MPNHWLFLILLLSLCKKNNIDLYRKSNIILIFVVKDKYNNLIKNANILLEPYNYNNPLKLTTDVNGILVLKDIHPYIYKMIIYKDGYQPKKFVLTINKSSKCTIYLNDSKKNRLYGFIRDENSNAISNALVVLYKILGCNNYYPVRFTYTDFSGEYNFIDIPTGNYIIKAKK